MKQKLLQGLAGVLLPLGLYGATPQGGYGSYYRPNVRVSASKIGAADGDQLSKFDQVQRPADFQTPVEAHNAISVSDELTLLAPKRELLIIDAAVPDKHLFMRDLRAGVDVAIIDTNADGLEQLERILAGRTNISALHIVSHANDGVLQLGDTYVTNELLQERLTTLSILDKALIDGADLLLYGCDLAETEKGQDLLELISGAANVDIAASDDLTGSAKRGGDWELEIVLGDIEFDAPFSDKALMDFSAILQTAFEFDVLGVAGGGYKSAYDNAIAGGTQAWVQVSDTFSYVATQYMYWDAVGSSADMYIVPDGVNYSKWDVSAINLYSIYGGGNVTLDSTSYVVFSIDGGGPVTRNFSGDQVLTGASTDMFGFFTNTAAVTDVTSVKMVLYMDAGSASTNISDLGFKSITLEASGGGGGGGGGGANPLINNLDGDSFNHDEDEGAEIIDVSGDATVTDADAPANLNTGNLTVSVTGNADISEDLLSFSTAGGFINLSGTTAGSNVQVDEDGGADGFVTVGTLGNNIAEGNDLVVNFNANATLDTTNVLLQRVTYENTDETAPTENNRTVSFTVTDETAATSAAADVTITVIGVNDAPTDISLSSATIAAGSTGAGADVGTLSATDVDGGGPAFSLVGDGTSITGTCGGATGDDDNASFQINGTTLETSGALAAASYDVCVEIDDGSGTTFQKNFPITVTAAANTAPSDISLALSGSVTTATASGTTIGTLSQTDPDADTWTFDLVASGTATDVGVCASDADNGSFNITGTSLETAASLAERDYNICTRVSDGTATYKETLTISVAAFPDDLEDRLKDLLNNLGDASLGLALSPGSLDVPEGVSNAFIVQLTESLTAAANIQVTAGDGIEISGSNASFSLTDESDQEFVNFTVIDDNIADGNRESTITLNATSGGQQVSETFVVNIVDNDEAGITVETATLSPLEEGSTAVSTFTVALASQPEDTVDIQLTAGSSVSLDTSTLQFSPSNWNVSQLVTVSAVDDSEDFGTQEVPIDIAVADTSDVLYQALDAVSVSVSVLDNDTVKIGELTVSADSLSASATANYVFTQVFDEALNDVLSVEISFPGQFDLSDITPEVSIPGASYTPTLKAGSTSTYQFNLGAPVDISAGSSVPITFAGIANPAMAGRLSAFTIKTFNDDGSLIAESAFPASQDAQGLTINAPPPTITSAVLNVSTGKLMVTGANFVATEGSNNDVSFAGNFLFFGTTFVENVPPVDISDSTSFTFDLPLSEDVFRQSEIDRNGAENSSGKSYSLFASSGWMGDASEEVTVPFTVTGVTTQPPTDIVLTQPSRIFQSFETHVFVGSLSAVDNDDPEEFRFSLVEPASSNGACPDTATIDGYSLSGTQLTKSNVRDSGTFEVCVQVEDAQAYKFVDVVEVEVLDAPSVVLTPSSVPLSATGALSVVSEVSLASEEDISVYTLINFYIRDPDPSTRGVCEEGSNDGNKGIGSQVGQANFSMSNRTINAQLVTMDALPAGEYPLCIYYDAFTAEGGSVGYEQPVVLTITEPVPEIASVIIPNETKVLGETVTATLTIEPASADFSGMTLSGTIGGFELTNFKRVEGSTYTADLTIASAQTQVFGAANVSYSSGSGDHTLDGASAWVAAADDAVTAITFDLGEIKTVTGVRIQASGSNPEQYVERATISVSLDGSSYDPVFQGKEAVTASGGEVDILFDSPIQARLVEVSASAWKGAAAAMRAGVLGASADTSDNTALSDIPATDAINVDLNLSDDEGVEQATYTESIVQDNDAILITPAAINLSLGSDVEEGVDEGSSFTVIATATDAFDNPWPRELSVPLSFADSEAGGDSSLFVDEAEDDFDYINGVRVPGGNASDGFSSPTNLGVIGDRVEVAGWLNETSSGETVSGEDVYQFTAARTASYSIAIQASNPVEGAHFSVLESSTEIAGYKIERSDLTDSNDPDAAPFQKILTFNVTAGNSYRISLYSGGSPTPMRYSFSVGEHSADFAGPDSISIPGSGSGSGTIHVSNDGIVEPGIGGNGEIIMVALDSANLPATAQAGDSPSVQVRIIDGAPPPQILSVELAAGTHLVGDTVTATLKVTANEEDYSAAGSLSGSIAGISNLSSFTRISESDDASDIYSVTFTVTKFDTDTDSNGTADFPASDNVPVNLTLTNADGLSSTAYTTPIISDNDAIYRTPVRVSLDNPGTVEVTEGETMRINFSMSPSGILGERGFAVSLQTTAGSPDVTSGGDYYLNVGTGRVLFAGEEAVLAVQLEAVRDSIEEGNETVTLSIDQDTLPAFLKLGERSTISITIMDIPTTRNTTASSLIDISSGYESSSADSIADALQSSFASKLSSLGKTTGANRRAVFFTILSTSLRGEFENADVLALESAPLAQDPESGDVTGSVAEEAAESAFCSGSNELRGLLCVDSDSLARTLANNPNGAADTNGAFWYLLPQAVVVTNNSEDTYFGTDDGLILIDEGAQGEGKRMVYSAGTLDLNIALSTGVTVNDAGVFIDATKAGAGIDSVSLSGLANVDLGEPMQVPLLSVTDGSDSAAEDIYFVTAVNPVSFLVADASATGLSVDTASTDSSLASAYITYEDDFGAKRRQELVRWPRHWNVLQHTLEQVEGVTRARIDSTGLITVTANGSDIRAVADYLVQGSDTEFGVLTAEEGVAFTPAGDQNGDGIMDYTMTWPNGDQQTLLILTP